MYFDYPPEVKQWLEEFRRYLDRIVTPELKQELAGGIGEGGGPRPHTKAFWRKLGEGGYMGLGWPEEYGGGGMSPLYLHAYNHEMSVRSLPVATVTLNMVGPALMLAGSEAQKKEFLPKILRGEVEFAIGYTEPEAGTDLASLKTRAVRDGDYYVINGQKVFTTGAESADYCWLACRTDPEAPKHRGISVIIVPLNSEGITIHPFPLMWGGRTNFVFYDNVRVPVSNCVGEENRGWYYMTAQLNFERVAISPVIGMERTFNSLCDQVRREGSNGAQEWTRTALAGMAAGIYAMKVFDLRVAGIVADAELAPSEASIIKTMANELSIKMAGEALQILGPTGLIRRGWPGGSSFPQQRLNVNNLFGGGNNDIQRDLIATHGLNLPR